MKLAVVFLLSVVLAAAVQQNAHVRTVSQPKNSRCANSRFMTGDIFPNARGGLIVRISKIVDSQGVVVGWTFKTERGGEFAQATHRMAPDDLARVGLHLNASDRLSPIFPLHANPWPDLRIKLCRPSEMQQAKFAPWRSDQI